MNINDVFPSKYLKAADLQGHEPTVVINRCEVEAIGDQRKLVLYFQGKEKGMICNRTNADRIAFMYSPDTDHWIGKPITLFTDMVSFQGKTMQALRVKPPSSRNGGIYGEVKSPQPQPPQPPRRISATGQPQHFVAKDHGQFKTSTTQAATAQDDVMQQIRQPDVDELPDDDSVPF